MAKLILILGGARSGKSTFAEQWAVKSGASVTYIATAQPGDPEMAMRIKHHQFARPDTWTTREIPTNIAQAVSEDPIKADTVLLDCITMLVSNLILQSGQETPPEEQVTQAVDEEIQGLIELIGSSQGAWLLVSNEVGAGLVPPYPLGRLYRDLLGRANQQLARAAGEVYYLVAGVALPLHKIGLRIQDLSLE